MSSNESRAKVASITVIVDDSPVIMIFNNIQAALKLKQRLREAFPDTVFTKSITNEMLEKQAKKIAGLMIQRRLFISPTLNGEDLRVEIQGKIKSNPFMKKPVAHLTIGAPLPAQYKTALSDKIKEAERCAGKVTGMSQPQVSVIDGCTTTVPSISPAAIAFAQPEQLQQQQTQQQSQQQQQHTFSRRDSSCMTTGTPATQQTQGDINLPSASVVPISIATGAAGASLASANVLSAGAVNAGHGILALGALPITQSNASNMTTQAAIGSVQGQQLRIITIPQMQAATVTNQQGGYSGALGGRVLTPQQISGMSYQGVATYASGPQATPYVTTIQQNGQQLTQLVSNPAVLAQIASTAMMGKMPSQSQTVIPIAIQPTVHSAAAVASLSVPGSTGNGQVAKPQQSFADTSASMSAATTVKNQQADQAKVDDLPSSSLDTSYDSQVSNESNDSEIALTVDSDKFETYTIAREVFYTSKHNILVSEDKPSAENTSTTTSPLLELITGWSSKIRQSRPASPMSVTQQDGSFYQYYKQASMNHDTSHTLVPKMPKLWSPGNQLSLFIHVYDQVFSKMPGNVKQTWEEHKHAFLNSSVADTGILARTIEKSALDDNDLSSPLSTAHPSLLSESSSSLSSSSKAAVNITSAHTVQSTDEQETSKSAASIHLQSKDMVKTEKAATTTVTAPASSAVPLSLPRDAFTFARNMFANVPTLSNINPLQTGQGLLNSADSNKFFSNTLAQFSAPINLNDFMQKNPNLSTIATGGGLNIGLDNRMRQELRPQEVTAQLLSNFSNPNSVTGFNSLSLLNSQNNFLSANANDISTLFRNYQQPMFGANTLTNLPMKTMFNTPMNTINFMPQQSYINFLFHPSKTFQIDVIIFLYLLSFGVRVEEVQVQNDNPDLSFLSFETCLNISNEYVYKKCGDIKAKLLSLYRGDDLFKLKKTTSNLYSRGNIRETVINYVACAQSANMALQMALQTNTDPEKAILNLPCILLDSAQLTFVLSRTKENAPGKDKDIDKLLESITFMNGQLTRKEFYNKARASQNIPYIPPIPLGSVTSTGPELKKHIRL